MLATSCILFDKFMGIYDPQLQFLVHVHWLVEMNCVLFHYLLQEAGKAEVDRIMLTDAPLLFPPGQVIVGHWMCFYASFASCLDTGTTNSKDLNSGHGSRNGCVVIITVSCYCGVI